MPISAPIKLQSGGEVNPDYLAHIEAFFADADDRQSFVHACGRPLRKSIRVNTLKISVEQFLTVAEQNGWRLSAIPWCPTGFWIEADDADESLGNAPAHLQGLFYIQEASSMLPPQALLAGQEIQQPLIVDMAAAPGSKTTQLAALTHNRGVILANELSASRLKSLHANLIRCGISNACLSHLDAAQIGELMPGQFDYVLLDAPCGGEGTVRKDPQALKNWSLESVKELAILQKKLIRSAYAALKPGGRLVYSTCTLSPEENHQVADYLCEHSDAKIEPLAELFDGAQSAVTPEGYLHLMPQQFDSEGFFVARFKKPQSSLVSARPVPVFDTPFVTMTRAECEKIVDYYKRHFGIEIAAKGFELRRRDKAVWLFPQDLNRINRYLKVNRAGIKLGEVYPNKIRSSHEFASCFGDDAGKQVIALNEDQTSQFIRGQNIEVEPRGIVKGEVLLTFGGHIIGIGQHQSGRIKNGLPRDLVKDNFVINNNPAR